MGTGTAFITRIVDRAKRHRAKLPKSIAQDSVAGLTGAIGSVPSGMAAGTLAGVNPIYGLYGSIAGPIAGGFLSSNQLMVITTTNAAALAAAESLSRFSGAERASALFLLTAIAGIMQVVAGVLRLGRFVRFVSHSVMIGFLTGIAVLIILGQIPTITGFGSASGSNKITQTIDVLRHPGQINLASLAVGITAILLTAILSKTRIRSAGMLFALVIPSVAVALLSVTSVELIGDVSEIPGSLPIPALPSFSYLSVDLITGAAAVAIIILVQGAGVAQSVANPDGSTTSASRDFIAQGGANVAAGLVQGTPVGGSVSQTAINLGAGARSRWAAVITGLWLVVVVVVFSQLIANVAMPTLAGLLIVAGYRTINLSEASSIWQTGWSPRIVILTTFVGTLVLPIQLAVGIGVLLTILLYLNSSAVDVLVVEVVELPDHRFEEREPPQTLPDHTITILDVYGSIFFAGARTLQRLLPSPRGAEVPVVVIRMRGRSQVGATFIDVLDSYAEQIGAAGGHLYLAGIDPNVHRQLARTEKFRQGGMISVYPATSIVWESTLMALDDARAWLMEHSRSEDRAREIPPVN